MSTATNQINRLAKLSQAERGILSAINALSCLVEDDTLQAWLPELLVCKHRVAKEIDAEVQLRINQRRQHYQKENPNG